MTILLYSIYRILMMVIDVYWVLLGVYTLLSWFPGAYQTGLGRLVRYFVEPLIKPFRRLRLQVGFLDFTVLLVFLVLGVARRLLFQLFASLFLL